MLGSGTYSDMFLHALVNKLAPIVACGGVLADWIIERR